MYRVIAIGGTIFQVRLPTGEFLTFEAGEIDENSKWVGGGYVWIETEDLRDVVREVVGLPDLADEEIQLPF